jgi:hypothetical protein
MPDVCTVLIAAPSLLPSLKVRTADADELLTFADTEVLRALEVITARRPRVVAIERGFSATPRGAALINRIKADPSLAQSEIRVVSRDSDYAPASPRTPANGADPVLPAAIAPSLPGQPLDQRGTRRASRVRIGGCVEVLVDGKPLVLVDLSVVGAQGVSPTVLKPNQRVRVALPDEVAAVRFNAAVAWAAFEMPKSGAQYRAGIDFLDADPSAVDAFCQRHKAR